MLSSPKPNRAERLFRLSSFFMRFGVSAIFFSTNYFHDDNVMWPETTVALYEPQIRLTKQTRKCTYIHTYICIHVFIHIYVCMWVLCSCYRNARLYVWNFSLENAKSGDSTIKKSGMSQHQSLLPQVSDCCYVENKFREFSPSKAITFIMCFFWYLENFKV